MNITDQIEEKLGLKVEELNSAEKETYFQMLSDVERTKLTPESLKDYITQMREAVTHDLIKEPEFHYVFIFKVFNRKQVLLKARLQNYILLESFLEAPKKAKKTLEEMVENLGKT